MPQVYKFAPCTTISVNPGQNKVLCCHCSAFLILPEVYMKYPFYYTNPYLYHEYSLYTKSITVFDINSKGENKFKFVFECLIYYCSNEMMQLRIQEESSLYIYSVF